MKPIPAYKGKQLNQLVDRYLNEGVDEDRDLLEQGSELAYIQLMHHEKETRLSKEEYRAICKMQDFIGDRLRATMDF